MLVLFCKCQVLLVLLVRVSLAMNLKKSQPPQVTKERVFADVIKNISRVNNELQELIKSYQQLKKITSEETFESADVSTDSEVDEQFKARQEKQGKSEVYTTRSFPGTEMFVSEEEEERDSEQNAKNKKLSNEQTKNPARSRVKTNKDDIVKIGVASLSVINVGDSHTNKPNIRSQSKTTPIPHKKSIIPELHNIVENLIAKKLASNESRPIEKVLYSEGFGKDNMWREIIKNKPKNLTKESTEIYFRSKPVSNGTSDPQNSDTPNTEEVDTTIKKEEFKTRILRKAYGDACLKVVIRKCYKATKATVKHVCGHKGCKSMLKSEILQHSKRECIDEFESKYLREKIDSEPSMKTDDNLGFLDVSRNGYLAAACLPNTKPASAVLHKNISISKPIEPYDTNKDINILRSRFERACQEISVKKCSKACSTACNRGCRKFECNNYMVDSFSKQCSKKCSKTYSGSTTSEKKKKEQKNNDKNKSSEKKKNKDTSSENESGTESSADSASTSTSGTSSDTDKNTMLLTKPQAKHLF